MHIFIYVVQLKPSQICFTVPDAPAKYSFNINDNSVIDFNWIHPWRTGSPLNYFLIQIQQLSSRLRSLQLLEIETLEYQVTNYTRDYSMRLYLLPSTNYNISIESVTITGEKSNVKSMALRTPSTINFSEDLQVKKYNSMVFLSIPHVLNDTYDSILRIIVKGPNPCEQYTEISPSLMEQIGMKMHDVVWQAAEISVYSLSLLIAFLKSIIYVCYN